MDFITGLVGMGLDIYRTIQQDKANEEMIKYLGDISDQVTQNGYMLNQTLDEVRQNGDDIRANGEAINRTYEAIQQFEYNVNANFEASFTHFIAIEERLNDALTSIENSKVEIIDHIELAKAEILQSVKDSRTEPIVSDLKAFFEYFINEAKVINAIAPHKRIAKLEETDGIMQYLKKSRTPATGTLHSLLSHIINEKFAIPTGKDDKMAIVILELLCYGMHVYSLIIYFMLQQYSILIENYYHKSDLDKYNQYYLLNMQNFVEFSSTLTDFLGKVTVVLNTVKNLEFFSSFGDDELHFIDKTLGDFHSTKSVLDKIGKSFDSQIPAKLNVKLDFSTSKIKTPIEKWKSGVSVKYAIQYLAHGTKLSSMVSDWSSGYTIDDAANPIVRIPADASGRVRAIFRKFDDGIAQLVGIIKNSAQTEFRDINRELYSAAMQLNEKIALKEIAIYIENGADVNVGLEHEKRALHVAAENDNWSVAAVLIQNGSNVDVQDDNGHTPIYIATEAGFESFVQNLVNNCANVNVKTNKAHLELVPLHSAAYKGHKGIVQLLLKVPNIEVNAQSSAGFTAMHFAASFGQADVVSMLVADNRTQVDVKSKQLFTPLHMASINNCDKAVQTLLDTGRVNINARATNNNATALHLAAFYDSKEVVSTLLERGADFKAKTVNGATVVHFAAANGNADIAGSVSFEDIVDAQDNREIIPLYLAYQYNNTRAAAKLVQSCANANIRLSGHKTLLHLAAINGDFYAVDNLVEQNFFPIDSKDYLGRVPLYYAVQNGREEIARTLLQNSANPNSKDADNKPVFHLAADLDEIDALNLAKVLWQYNANINIVDNFGATLMHLVTKRGFLSSIKYLVEKGADVNAKTIYNETPLRLAKLLQPSKTEIATFLTKNSATDSGDTLDLFDACRKGNLNMIKYLHEIHGVDVNLKDNTNQNALFKAISGNGNLEIVKYLVKIGVSIHEIDSDKNSLVNYAVAYNKFDITKYLVEQGVEFRLANKNADSPLHNAAMKGNFEMVKYFLHLGLSANVNDKGSAKQTPLIRAIQYDGDLKLVKYLIKSGAQTNITDESGKTAVAWAADKGKSDIKQYLEQLTNDSKLQTQIDTNSLFFAAAQNNVTLVEQYLNKKIAVDVMDEDDGETPLYSAIHYNGGLDMIKLLHSKGANIRQSNSAKEENLVYLSIIKRKFDVAKYLLDNRASYLTSGVSGNTPLHGAVEADSIEMVKYLLDLGSYNHKNYAGKTPFDLMIEGQKHKLAKYLVFEYKNKREQTMLHKVASQGDDASVKFFLERGAHVNWVDDVKETPLHLAARNGHLESVKMMVQQICVNITAENSHGKTALELAQLSNKQNVVDFLSEQIKKLANPTQFSESAKSSANKPTFWLNDVFNGFAGTLKTVTESLT